MKKIKNTTNEYIHFLESNFAGVHKLFVLVYWEIESILIYRSNDVKRIKTRRYYLPKGIIDNYKMIINGKKLLSPTNWFWYKTIQRN